MLKNLLFGILILQLLHWHGCVSVSSVCVWNPVMCDLPISCLHLSQNDLLLPPILFGTATSPGKFWVRKMVTMGVRAFQIKYASTWDKSLHLLCTLQILSSIPPAFLSTCETSLLAMCQHRPHHCSFVSCYALAATLDSHSSFWYLDHRSSSSVHHCHVHQRGFCLMLSLSCVLCVCVM